MAREKHLEALIQKEIGRMPGLTEKAMFGGLAWMLDGHLLCAARDDGMLVRLGKGQDAWALQIDGIVAMRLGDRPMTGWVRCGANVYDDATLRKRLISQAITFVGSLPPK
ncbi:TfoX/Sxy family protein [Singulisphaera rosea]